MESHLAGSERLLTRVTNAAPTDAAALAEDLGTRLSLRGRLVVEVGCGKGEFLRRLKFHRGVRSASEYGLLEGA